MIKNRFKTDPVPVVRQHRPVRVRNITTAPPGKIVPVAAFGLLQGDSCSGRLNVAFEMNETYEVLFNRMQARVNVWFIPKVANERFQRNKTFFERAAEGAPSTDEEGAEVIPFQETHVYTAPAVPIYKHLGLSAKAGAMVTTDYREGYNLLVSHAYRQRSKSLPARLKDETSLATAMWGPNAFSEIVPDFDEGMIAGEMPMTIVQSRLPIFAESIEATGVISPSPVRNKGGGAANQGRHLGLTNDTGAPFWEMYALQSQDGVTISLANFDQARKLVDWAKVRESYEGHTDPHIIDRLMAGLPVDEQMYMYPMLIDSKMVDIPQVKRMATDGSSLEDGVANGARRLDVGVNVPANPYGGVVIVTSEFFPEQLYERQADPYFTTTSLDELPRYDRDVMNPMPVVEVKNGEVDVAHSTPEGRFGYARRNWKWANNPSRVGGDLFAPNNDSATAVERRMIYPTEVANPTLNMEFYLTGTLGREVFLDETKDPIKVGVGGVIDVVGLTVIGEVHESEANYDAVRAEYPPLQGVKA